MNKTEDDDKICFRCKKQFEQYIKIDGKYKPDCCYSKEAIEERNEKKETNNENIRNKFYKCIEINVHCANLLLSIYLF